MNLLCISASNIAPAREHSASTHVCELIRDIISAMRMADVSVDILPLIEHEMKPCRMCGDCFNQGKCVRDEAFNTIYSRMIAADAIFLVCPHYAPIPSKVMILLEKLEEMMFLRSCADPDYRFTLYRKPIGIIVHGGQTAEALPYYRTALLDPLAGGFASVQMDVVGADDQWPNGVTFGIKSISKPADSLFVTIEHDWADVLNRITPLVTNVLAHVSRNS